MMWFWLHQAMISSLDWSSLHLSELAIPNLRPCLSVSQSEKSSAHSWLGMSSFTADSEHSGMIMSLGNTLVNPRAREGCRRKGRSGHLCLDCWPRKVEVGGWPVLADEYISHALIWIISNWKTIWCFTGKLENRQSWQNNQHSLCFIIVVVIVTLPVHLLKT